jgi:hypothetical protein
MAYAVKQTIPQLAVGKRPVRVWAAIKKSADATVGPNENQWRSVALHAEEMFERNLV